MEELGFAIAVPETMLCGFAILVVLAVIILIKVLKTSRQIDRIYDYVDDINERQKRIESIIDRLIVK